MSLAELPDDLLCEIVARVDLASHIAVDFTCKRLHQALLKARETKMMIFSEMRFEEMLGEVARSCSWTFFLWLHSVVAIEKKFRRRMALAALRNGNEEFFINMQNRYDLVRKLKEKVLWAAVGQYASTSTLQNLTASIVHGHHKATLLLGLAKRNDLELFKKSIDYAKKKAEGTSDALEEFRKSYTINRNVSTAVSDFDSRLVKSARPLLEFISCDLRVPISPGGVLLRDIDNQMASHCSCSRLHGEPRQEQGLGVAATHPTPLQ